MFGTGTRGGEGGGGGRGRRGRGRKALSMYMSSGISFPKNFSQRKCAQ